MQVIVKTKDPSFEGNTHLLLSSVADPDPQQSEKPNPDPHPHQSDIPHAAERDIRKP
jgi:hypothetical protein